jgi:hypothetical protein
MDLNLSVQTKINILVFSMIFCILMACFHIYSTNKIIVGDFGKIDYSSSDFINVEYVDNTKENISRIEMHEIFKHLINTIMWLFVSLLLFIESRRWEDGERESQ